MNAAETIGAFLAGKDAMQRLFARVLAILALVTGIGLGVTVPANAAPIQTAVHSQTQTHSRVIFAEDWWW